MSLNYLLDTSCLIWFQENSPKIPKKVMDIIQDTENNIFFSQISLFEIAIKQKIGKLPLFVSTVDEVYHQAIKDDFVFMQLQNRHLSCYDKVPLYEIHRDPFDRLLISTAFEEKLIVLTSDQNFKLYTDIINVFW